MLLLWSIQPDLRPSHLGLRPGWLSRPQVLPSQLAQRPSLLAKRTGWLPRGRDKWQDGHREFLPIPDKIVPYRGHCPKSIWQDITLLYRPIVVNR